MPYRHAHWHLLLLFPLSGLAFWPNYFAKFAAAPSAFHVHGLTASLWIGLLAFQSWTIHRRRNALHRSAGLASFALFLLFVVGGLQSLLFETVGRTRLWEAVFASVARVPTPLIVSLGLAATAAILWAGWNAGRTPPRAVAAA